MFIVYCLHLPASYAMAPEGLSWKMSKGHMITFWANPRIQCHVTCRAAVECQRLRVAETHWQMLPYFVYVGYVNTCRRIYISNNCLLHYLSMFFHSRVHTYTRKHVDSAMLATLVNFFFDGVVCQG